MSQADELHEDPGATVRRHLLRAASGTLCTSSVKSGIEGYPFGSVVPFALTPEGLPILFIARIAAHTHNLQADPRASLFVRQPGLHGDPQTGWRITLIGDWAPVKRDDPRHPHLHARYTQRVPAAEGYQQTHDFTYWAMTEIKRVRYIGGFGDIHWLEGSAMIRDPQGAGIGSAAQGAIDHMNADHAHNMVEMCQGLYQFTPAQAQMRHLDRDGFLVETQGPDRLLYFPFEEEIDAAGLRHAVVAVLQRAREAIAAQARD